MTTAMKLVAAAITAATLAPSLGAQKPVAERSRDAVRRPVPAQPVVAAPKPAPTPTDGARRATYRISVTGFTVNKETYDDPLQLDGKRDEVYVSAEVALLDKDRKVLEPGAAIVQSKVFGDVGGMFGGTNGFNGRIQAGTASPQGGLRAGDEYPKMPWARQGQPTADALPLAVWQGELAQGANAVLVTPTLWEYDAPDIRAAFQSWAHWNEEATSALLGSPEFMTLLGTLVGPEAPATLTALAPLQKVELSLIDEIGKMGDRPIGMTVVTDPKTGKKAFTFAPTTIVLNYDTAERLLAQNVGGKGPGVIALPFRETDAKLGGSYTLYLLVERMP
jgi:hypothetical protein